MDSTETKGEAEEEEVETVVLEQKQKRSILYISLRFCCGVFLSLLALFSLTFSMLYIAVFVGNLSVWSPVTVPSRCKIVSSSVDLRFSKVCDLGLFNYKVKYIVYPVERKKFRCHYDYYWASVFKVEYADHSGRRQFALAEAPSEALPSDCRPNFGAVWLTKNRFKVNETYGCWYTMGISQVNIYQDGFFNCKAKVPSTTEMLKRYLILSSGRISSSWFAKGRFVGQWRWDAVAGAIAGFLTPFISFSLVGLLHRLRSRASRFYQARESAFSLNMVRLKRACFFVAYLSLMSWLAIQYVKRIGFPEIEVHYSW